MSRLSGISHSGGERLTVSTQHSTLPIHTDLSMNVLDYSRLHVAESAYVFLYIFLPHCPDAGVDSAGIDNKHN